MTLAGFFVGCYLQMFNQAIQALGSGTKGGFFGPGWLLTGQPASIGRLATIAATSRIFLKANILTGD